MTAMNVRMAKNRMHELASQVYILATGLQNAAPPGVVSPSIQYLLETAAQLEKASIAMDHLLQPTSS